MTSDNHHQAVLNRRAGKERIVVALVGPSIIRMIHDTCCYVAQIVCALEILQDVLFASIYTGACLWLTSPSLAQVEGAKAASCPQRVFAYVVVAGIAVLDVRPCCRTLVKVVAGIKVTTPNTIQILARYTIIIITAVESYDTVSNYRVGVTSGNSADGDGPVDIFLIGQAVIVCDSA